MNDVSKMIFVVLCLIAILPNQSYGFDITGDESNGDCASYVGTQTPMDVMPINCFDEYGKYFIDITVHFDFLGDVPVGFAPSCLSQLQPGSAPSNNACVELGSEAFTQACYSDSNMLINNNCNIVTTLSAALSQCQDYTPNCQLSIR